MEGLSWENICDLKVAKSMPNLKDIIDEEDYFGHTCLFVALYKEQFDTFCYFVDCGANIYKKHWDEFILHAAVRAGSIQCIEKILSAGIYINCKNGDGETALHECMDQGIFARYTLPMTLLLLKHKADVNVISNNNKSPLDLALDTRRHALIRCDLKDLSYAKHLVLAGGKLNNLTEKDIPLVFTIYFAKLSACKSASIAIRIALRKNKRVHKDIIPLIESMVFETKEEKEWQFF